MPRLWLLTGLVLCHSLAWAAPAVTINATPLSVTSGASSSLTWSSTDVTICAASGHWSGVKAAAGNQSVVPSGATSVYALKCSGPLGSASSAVTVLSGPANGTFEGYGGSVTGGAGGTTVMVTNLNNSGPGSLRDALSAPNRIVQFSVAGTINLATTLFLPGPNITLDGFSAPAPGITISGSSIEIGGNSSSPTTKGSNIIVKGLRFRGVPDDAVRIAFNAHDVVIDHNSFSGSTDGEVDVTEGAYNVTISNNILAKNNGPGASLLSYDTSRVSYFRNIFYRNQDRNPILTSTNIRGYSTGPAHTGPLADVRYNIVWGYVVGTYIISSGGSIGTANVVSNLYWTDYSNPSSVIVRATFDSTTRPEVYVAGNISVHDSRGCAYDYRNSCYPFPSTNSMNNHAEYSTPPITGPAFNDNQGRLDTWLAVKNGAGVVAKFADDAVDSEVRNAIAVPGLSVFSALWNN